MKKLLRGICLMGVVTLLATSCEKQQTNSMVYRGYSFDEKFEVENGNYENGSRAYIDENYRLKFEAGDQVMLFNVDSDNAANSQYALYVVEADSYQPIFAPYQPEERIDDAMKTAKYAFYPGNNVTKDAALLANGNRATFKLKDVQEYREGKIGKEALYMAAKIDNEAETGNNFAFRNICGVLQMKFYTEDASKVVKSITVTDSEFNLSGDVTLKVDQVDPAKMMELFRNYGSNQAAVAEYMEQLGYETDATGKTITLDCGTGATLSNSATSPTTFNFVLRPLALRKGFDMVITFTDGTSYTINTTRDNMIKPNTIRVWPVVKIG